MYLDSKVAPVLPDHGEEEGPEVLLLVVDLQHQPHEHRVHRHLQRRSGLKGACHEIFDLHIFFFIEPTHASDKQAEVFSNLVSTFPRYSITCKVRKFGLCGVHDTAESQL